MEFIPEIKDARVYKSNVRDSSLDAICGLFIIYMIMTQAFQWSNVADDEFYVNVLFSALTPAHKNITFAASTLKRKVMQKEKVNYQEVYDLYQLCSETKDLKEFFSEYSVNYDKFMNSNWNLHLMSRS